MAKPFDAAGKELIDPYVTGWLALAGLPAPAGPEAVQRGNVDLSGFTASADRIARVTAPVPYTAHLELQTGPNPDFDERTHLYNALAGRKYGRPVVSAVFLLRPAARTGVTGRILEEVVPGTGLDFRYRVVRVWELPVEQLLSGSLGLAPLAPLAALTEPARELPGIYSRVWQRLEREAPAKADDLWGITYVLSGLRHSSQLLNALMSGVHKMRDSTTYQAILAEGEAKGEAKGRADGERKMLIRMATRKLGPPDARALAALDAVTDVARLEAMGERVWEASSWAELLGGAENPDAAV